MDVFLCPMTERVPCRSWWNLGVVPLGTRGYRSEQAEQLRSAHPVASVGASQHRGGGAPRARLRADHRGAPARAGMDGVGGVGDQPSGSDRWESQRTGLGRHGRAPTALVAVLR